MSDWLTYKDRIGCPSDDVRRHLPDALVISPAKTATTWLDETLRLHPDMYLSERKEIRYFCQHWRRHDIGWYAAQFAAGDRRLKIDVSPTYAILPTSSIQVIREVIPGVKLLFFMRDPVSRAWSHAKHMCVNREGNFRNGGGIVGDVPIDDWARNFIQDWPLAFGNYADCLNRWLRFFPQEQVYVGFYEDIALDPVGVLQGVCRFLGAEPLAWARGDVTRRVFAGSPERPTPEQLRLMRFVLQQRTLEAARLLQDRFNLTVPTAWKQSLSAEALGGAYPIRDEYLGTSIQYDGDFFSARDRSVTFRARICEEVKIQLEGHTVAADTEDLALQRVLDSVLAVVR